MDKPAFLSDRSLKPDYIIVDEVTDYSYNKCEHGLDHDGFCSECYALLQEGL